ncbi:hypothetical protein BDB01DRAFT_836706 [Pilobolus umbonatus]|nr:hypothetical protein BDB01DRAFT_836706 [Pilobolus umbonatus]
MTLNDENGTITTVKTHIYQRARTQGALLFDFYSADLKIQMLREQHPNCFGLIAKKESHLEYHEVYIDKEDDDNDMRETGVYFSEQKIRVLPRRATSDASQIVYLNLSDIPMLKPSKVLEGIKKSLEVFGDILDIGLNYDPHHNFYIGTGYAVLDLNDLEGEITFQPLSHTISGCESTVEDFQVTWKNMPTWCRYCHEEGHNKFNCEKSKARIICYNCHEVGHRSAECHRNSPPSFKKSRKNPVKIASHAAPSTITEVTNPTSTTVSHVEETHENDMYANSSPSIPVQEDMEMDNDGSEFHINTDNALLPSPASPSLPIVASGTMSSTYWPSSSNIATPSGPNLLYTLSSSSPPLSFTFF